MSTLTDRIESVASAKGVPVQVIVDALIAACKRSIHKAYGNDLDVEIGLRDGVLEAFAFKEVVRDDQAITNPRRQIHLSKARAQDPEIILDDEYGEPIDVRSLERKACEPGQLERLFERHRKDREKHTSLTMPQKLESRIDAPEKAGYING